MEIKHKIHRLQKLHPKLPAPPFSLHLHICSTITGWWRFLQMLYLSTECWGLRVALNKPRTGLSRSPTPPTYLSTVSRAFSPNNLWHTRYTIQGMSHFTHENNGAVNHCNILHKSTPRHSLPNLRLKWGLKLGVETTIWWRSGVVMLSGYSPVVHRASHQPAAWLHGHFQQAGWGPMFASQGKDLNTAR